MPLEVPELPVPEDPPAPVLEVVPPPVELEPLPPEAPVVASSPAKGPSFVTKVEPPHCAAPAMAAKAPSARAILDW
jgi:hypothetical protein